MKKSDYLRLAQAIKENTRHVLFNNVEGEFVIDAHDFVNAICDMLKADNPKFNKEKFLELVK